MAAETLAAIKSLMGALEQSVIGQEEVVEALTLALLCNGNVMLEGFPGTAKTRSIKSLATLLEADLGALDTRLEAGDQPFAGLLAARQSGIDALAVGLRPDLHEVSAGLFLVRRHLRARFYGDLGIDSRACPARLLAGRRRLEGMIEGPAKTGTP